MLCIRLSGCVRPDGREAEGRKDRLQKGPYGMQWKENTGKCRHFFAVSGELCYDVGNARRFYHVKGNAF